MWCFKLLLSEMSSRLTHCCTLELLPLMELPAVKIGRAKQLYNAGFKTLNILAKTDPKTLVQAVDHMPQRIAHQIIAAAKLMLLAKAESLQEEAEDVLEGLRETSR
ncbi:helicase POLQ-like [Homalodisca vitripennis]|uniref:helicase POLQ-like n=1 Tax=Homalodisca vitripennis TaxID=197043 RepID=UPI001EEB90B9|nr:helicase POLQ-like [Homalodisca vitripennis]XP_046688442.1 helicase POLQ-like [Homalodisca vitripennis]KAG8303434.1 hypothetical protein J6590_010471 [Homalodisca vitripennis]